MIADVARLRPGDRVVFRTSHTDLAHANGQTMTVVEVVTLPDERFDAEVLPMVVCKDPSGAHVDAWPDELADE